MIRFPLIDPFYYPSDDWNTNTLPINEMDMYEEDNNLIVEFKAPGFDKEDLNISIESGVLVISGKLEEETEQGDKEDRKYYQKEIQTKSFSRRITLPVDVKADKAQAQFENGVLRLTLPKVEETKLKSMDISID